MSGISRVTLLFAYNAGGERMVKHALSVEISLTEGDLSPTAGGFRLPTDNFWLFFFSTQNDEVQLPGSFREKDARPLRCNAYPVQ